MPPTAVLREPSPASLVGWGETETSFRESVRRRGVMPVAYHHRTIAGGIGHNLPQEQAFADAVLQAGGRGT
jgi:hypothetical protein